MYKILWVINLSTHPAASSVVLGPARLTSSRNVLIMQSLYSINVDSKPVFLTRSLMIESSWEAWESQVIRSQQHSTGSEIVKIYKLKNFLPFLLVNCQVLQQIGWDGLWAEWWVSATQTSPLVTGEKHTLCLSKQDLTLLHQRINLGLRLWAGVLGWMRWSEEYGPIIFCYISGGQKWT